jgi:uncharacterized DUF497 family protein
MQSLTALPEDSSLSRVDYEWDIEKALQNQRKHGVDFNDTIAALNDPNRLEDFDGRFGYGEERTQIIGLTQGNVLFVVTTERGENLCRIISARRATRNEQNRYYAGDSEAR